MTDPRTDQAVGTRTPEVAPATPDEPNPQDGPMSAVAITIDGDRRATGVMRPVSAVMKPVSGSIAIVGTSVTAVRGGAGSLLARLPGAIDATLSGARDVAGAIVAHLPGTIGATRVGARDAASAVQALPDPTLRSLAATSVGLGAGFALAGSPRVVVVAGMVPAMIANAALALRTREPVAPDGPVVPNGPVAPNTPEG